MIMNKDLIAHLEDKYDIALANEAIEEYLSNSETYSHELVWKELLKEVKED